MNVEVKKLGNKHLEKFKDLIRVFEDVFAMQNFKMPPDNHLQGLLEKNDFFVFVACVGDQVVGGLTSYIMQQYYSERVLVYIFDLAVKTELQRKGIGKLLIEANNQYCLDIGAEAVMVEADEVDDHAIKFYHSTGAIALKTFHFDYLLNT